MATANRSVVCASCTNLTSGSSALIRSSYSSASAEDKVTSLFTGSCLASKFACIAKPSFGLMAKLAINM